MNYYYNNVPDKGQCRNNLVYTSLISEDQKTFCQWFSNDTEYHKGKNQVVDPELMEDKFHREVKYLSLMSVKYPHLVPKYELDTSEKKIYLEINGPDMWELAGCTGKDYSHIVSNWQEQMLNILQAYKSLGIYKYSLHPSSYFVVDGKLKSINHFFCHHADEGKLTLKDYQSHFSHDRQEQMQAALELFQIPWDEPVKQDTLQLFCLNTFRTNYSDEFIGKALKIYA
jgi:hypothetical protein